MDAIQVTLPDGKVQEVPKGTTPADIARKISPRLADAALVARVTATNDAPRQAPSGELIDLRRPLDHNVKLQILTEKDPDALFVFRHSAAHLARRRGDGALSQRQARHWPADRHRLFLRISARGAVHSGRSRQNRKEDARARRAGSCRTSASSCPSPKRSSSTKRPIRFSSANSSKKKPNEPMVSFYTTGKFIDFCRGPHIPSTKRIQAFKLMSVAGAYWKGHEGNPQLQRIYAACFLHAKRARRISAPPRRSQAPRSSQARRRARSLQHRGRSRTRPDFLASQGRPDSHNRRGLASRRNSSSAATTSSTRRTSCAANSGTPAATPAFTKTACSARWKSKKPITSSSP